MYISICIYICIYIYIYTCVHIDKFDCLNQYDCTYCICIYIYIYMYIYMYKDETMLWSNRVWVVWTENLCAHAIYMYTHLSIFTGKSTYAHAVGCVNGKFMYSHLTRNSEWVWTRQFVDIYILLVRKIKKFIFKLVQKQLNSRNSQIHLNLIVDKHICAHTYLCAHTYKSTHTHTHTRTSIYIQSVTDRYR